MEDELAAMKKAAVDSAKKRKKKSTTEVDVEEEVEINGNPGSSSIGLEPAVQAQCQRYKKVKNPPCTITKAGQRRRERRVVYISNLRRQLRALSVALKNTVRKIVHLSLP